MPPVKKKINSKVTFNFKSSFHESGVKRPSYGLLKLGMGVIRSVGGFPPPKKGA